MKTLLLLAVLIVAGCSSSRDNDPNYKKAQIYFVHGTESLMQRSYTDALRHLMKAAELDPENSEVHNNLGMAYYFKKEKTLAIKHIKKSLELDEKNSDARGNLASIFFEEGRMDEAEKQYRLVLKDLTYDKQARTYYNLGLIEIKRKNTELALENFRKSLEEEESYCPAYMQIGFIQYNRNQWKNALQSFRDAGMGVCISDPAPLYWQGLTYVEMGEYETARLKMDEITSKHSQTKYAQMARLKIAEIDGREEARHQETIRAERKLIQSPQF